MMADWIVNKSNNLKTFFACIQKNNSQDSSSYCLNLFESMFEKQPKYRFMLKDLKFVDYGFILADKDEKRNEKEYKWLKMTYFD